MRAYVRAVCCLQTNPGLAWSWILIRSRATHFATDALQRDSTHRKGGSAVTRQVVAITGGASGIGWASAELFARQGWMVVIADKSHERARERIPSGSTDMESVALDVTSTHCVEE